MIIGVPREIKNEEYRVGMVPSGVLELIQEGHAVLIETGAGEGSGFPDAEFADAGAEIVDRPTLFSRAELIVKVKEPISPEYDLLQEKHTLFTYLHLAPNKELTEALLRNRVTGIAYETLEENGALPLLAPMSEVAGRMAPLMAAFHLQKFTGGSGVLPTGVSGVLPGKIVILGAGVVGTNAARVAVGLGMETVVISKGADRLRQVDELFAGRAKTLPISQQVVAEEIRAADVVVGAVLVPGGKTPVLISRELLKTMKPGSIIVDVSVDQGGCVETSRPTTHGDPVFVVDGIVHYCVANMPGAYPRTSTLALTNATLPYVKHLANTGIDKAMETDEVIRSGLNTFQGKIMNKALADAIAAGGGAYR